MFYVESMLNDRLGNCYGPFQTIADAQNYLDENASLQGYYVTANPECLPALEP